MLVETCHLISTLQQCWIFGRFYLKQLSRICQLQPTLSSIYSNAWYSPTLFRKTCLPGVCSNRPRPDAEVSAGRDRFSVKLHHSPMLTLVTKKLSTGANGQKEELYPLRFVRDSIPTPAKARSPLTTTGARPGNLTSCDHADQAPAPVSGPGSGSNGAPLLACLDQALIHDRRRRSAVGRPQQRGPG